MDLDGAKENIMPLACGRNVRYLQTALSAENDHELMAELQKQRQEFEKAIHEYEGDDPLELWFNYIQWIEQSYPSGGKENGLFEVLQQCLGKFECNEKYFQDRRMIKLWIKYLDNQKDPQEFYQTLYNQGIGTMVADLYICWAYYYDLCGNFAKADEIFRKGVDARAQPFDELEQAHKHFGFTMSQRLLYKDEESNLQFMSSLQERRHALTSLRTHKKNVGSIRTGAAVKSFNPGKVELASKTPAQRSNVAIKVFDDQNHDPNAVEPSTSVPPTEEHPMSQSLVRSIIDSTRKQENIREPGPWSKARLNKKRSVCLLGSGSHHEPGFEILEDDNADYRAPLPKGDDNFSKGIQLPPDFVRQNVPLPKWEVPPTLDTDGVRANMYPCYEKTQLYPKENEVYCPEEYRGWCWFKKRGISNQFTQKHDHIWTPNLDYGFHLYPNFCKKNLEQTEFSTKRFVQDEDISANHNFTFAFKEVYPDDSTEEFSFEEILWKKVREGKRKLQLNTDETILMAEDLDETQCVAGAAPRDRRSLFPSRRSVLPKMMAPIVEAPIQPRRSVITLNPQGSPPLDNQQVSVQQRTAEAPVSNISHDKAEAQIRQGLVGESGFPSVLRKISSFSSGEDTEKEDKLKQKTTAPQILARVGSLENDCGPRDEVLPKALPSATKISNFEDDYDDGDVFKAPQSFPRPAKQRVSIHPVQDEEDEEKATDAFVVNETCSTQTFNFFIKSQSVSTPKHLRKSQGVCLQEQELPAPRTLMSPPTPPTENENQLNMTPANTLFPPKQLSIIMELTETNTVSSGTKSTAETHDFDSESSKSNYTTKPSSLEQYPMLDPILEVSAAQKSREAGRQSPQVNRDVMKMTDEEAMPALMMSMKVFEDKTETVPKMLLTKLGSNPPPSTNDDDYATLFTTTPTKASQFLADKVNPSVVNESMTFSKLSEITLPRLESGKIVSKFVPTKEQVQQGWHEASLKKDGMNVDDCGLANDSITFSKLKDLTNPGGLMDKGKKQVEPSEQRQKVFGDGSFDDKSLLEAFETSLGSKHLRNFNPSAAKFETSDIKLEFKEPAMPNVPSENLTMSTMNLIGAKNSSISEVPFFPSTSQIQESSVHIKQEPFEAVSGGKIVNFRSSSTSSQASSIPQTPKTHEASAHGERGLGDSICAGKSNSHHGSSSSVQERSILSRFAEISRRQSEKVDESLNIDSSLHASNIGHFQEQLGVVSMKNQSVVWFHGQDSISRPSAIVKQEKGATGIFSELKSQPTDLGRSIYVRRTPENRKKHCQDWSYDEEISEDNHFVHANVDLDQTRILITDKINQNVNPFDRELIKAFLDNIEISSFIEKLPTCTMVNRVRPLQKGSSVTVANVNFDVLKTVGEGSYGSIFCAKERSTGNLFAIKQEKPANLWEYYICLELKSRINNDKMMRGFMDVEYALIGNNASLLFTEFSKYGSLIDVCYKVHAATGKNIDEFVVMVLASQLLLIMDHLHASKIIHADIKPDNFLLMSKLAHPSDTPSVQLIDFGVSIDLLSFLPKQTFNYVTRTEGFTCIEMLENRPWTYQPDLFGLAGTIHVLLFGKYMDVEKRHTGWNIKTHMPRYLNRSLWNSIFTTLLNIRDCDSMPNLQQLRVMLGEEIVENEKHVQDKIREFNLAIER